MLYVFSLFFLASCSWSEVSKDRLISLMDEQLLEKNSHINIVWYEGSDKTHHYLSHVYSMTGTKYYKVPITEMEIENKLRLR